MILPIDCKTFDSYIKDKCIPHVENQLKDCQRLDIVWDVYKEHSLKAETRVKGGLGVRRKVTGNTPIPSNWPLFLCDDKNKTELNEILAKNVMSFCAHENKQLIFMHGETVLA